MIRNIIERVAKSVLAGSGLPLLLHSTVLKDQLTILMYHAVVRTPLPVYEQCFMEETSFRSQMRYLSEHFDVLRLPEAVSSVQRAALRRPTAAITFDDGFQNNYDVAYPILKEFKLPATVFLTTGLIDSDETLWFCRLNRAMAVTRLRELEWDGCRFDLSEPELRARACQIIQKRVKRRPHDELLAEISNVISLLGDDPNRPEDKGSPYRMLTRDQIREMADSGLIDFGAHTHRHAILSRISPQEQALEIRRSVEAVERLSGRRCVLFAYPNGSKEDYDGTAVQALETEGIKAAVTTISGPNGRWCAPLELKRYGIPAGCSLAYFELVAHHLATLKRRVYWRRA